MSARKRSIATFWERWGRAQRWRAHPLNHRAEIGVFPSAVRRALFRAGFTCRSQVITCPDWLLRTVPGIGPKSLRHIRERLPFDPDLPWDADCPEQPPMRETILRDMIGT